MGRSMIPGELVFVTGLSGTGKSGAMRCFEDKGYFCVDNLPVGLIPVFTDLCFQSSGMKKIALVIDIREGEFLKEFPPIYRKLQETVRNVTVLFLEASDEVLRRRFSETRRPHPLAKDGAVDRGIREERKVLAPLRAMATRIIDTSKFNIHDLKAYINKVFLGAGGEEALFISVLSFGFKHGIPAESDFVLDVRFLPNPFFVEKLRTGSGLNPEVVEYVKSHPRYGEFLKRTESLLEFLIPEYVREGKTYLTVSFGCTGGRHRSVALAEEVGRFLQTKGLPSRITHRDIDKE